MFVLILCRGFFFSPLVAKLIGPRTGCQFFKKKNVDFSDTYPLNLDLVSMTFVTSCGAEGVNKVNTRKYFMSG